MHTEFQQKSDEYFLKIGPKDLNDTYDAIRCLYSLLHGKKRIMQQGVEMFNSFLHDFQSEHRFKGRERRNLLKKKLVKTPEFKELLSLSIEVNSGNFVHPKMLKTLELLLEFFHERT